MAGTRRSTRQSTFADPKYSQSSPSTSDADPPKANSIKTICRKRARDDDEDSPPPKRTVKPKRTPKSTSKTAAARLATPSNPSNRDAQGLQQVFWLLKAEPLPRYENGVNVAFSIDDLQKCTAPEPWTGVRNPQARNNMRMMRKGDLGFFYHSNAKPSGVVGVLRVAREAEVDTTAFDKHDPYYDPKSDRENPKWYCVAVEFVKKFDDVVDLHRIKGYAASTGPLEKMQLVTNSRLSVSRVSRGEWDFIMDLAEGKGG
ncbi:DUF55-domain-containing protein [Lojkania enalia]|uniref:Thymocyte nuclear protein 1 n=1 Tax=Lojkania enalia TaxID=147567 RepID=A0A9P4KCQ6_9PLEO|nr:DUF55-domain-containing protein [Didymosphaeria enalia]